MDALMARLAVGARPEHELGRAVTELVRNGGEGGFEPTESARMISNLLKEQEFLYP